MKRMYIIVTILCLLPRIFDLRSDPPSDLSESGGYFADEGFWTHNARNEVLFGRAELDEWNNMYTSPLTHWPTLISFRLFGVGLIQARIFPVVCSLVSVMLLLYGLPGYASVIAAVLFSISTICIHFGRLALLEAPVMLFLLASWILFIRKNVSMRDLFVSGFLAGCALGIKMSVWYFVPAAALTIAISPPGDTRIKPLIVFGAGVLSAGGLWLLLLGPNIRYFLQYTAYYSSQQTPWFNNLSDNIRNPVFFERFRTAPLAAGFMLFIAAGSLPAIWSKHSSRAVLLPTIWFASGLLYLTTLSYAPLRYYVPLIAPGIILIAMGVTSLFEGPIRFRLTIPGLILLFLFLWPFIWSSAVKLIPRLAWWSSSRIGLSMIAVCVGIIMVWNLGAYLFRSRLFSLGFIGTILIIHCAIQVNHFITWASNRNYDILSTSTELGSRFPGGIFTGQWAPVLCMENENQAIPVWPGFINESEPFQRYGITHGVIWERHWDRFNEWYPQEFAAAYILDTLTIKDSPVLLCRFLPQEGRSPHRPQYFVIMRPE